MRKITGIRLRPNGKIYDFDSGHFVLKKGDRVIVNTEQGNALGVVATEQRQQEDGERARDFKSVQRVASDDDIKTDEKNREMEKEVYLFCYEKIQERALPMSLVTAEQLFDGSKVVVYFSAEGRVDFRDLVKDLVQKFHTRIEMRQIGVRHQAKMVGGLGACGRELCCSAFLNKFDPVSIKMAKKQSLSLNPTKISGMCGRLMCCLSYEYDFYNKASKNVPKIGKNIQTEKGSGKVIRNNILKESVTILLDSEEEIDVLYGEIIIDNKRVEEEEEPDTEIIE
ncbi:MAG: stage 0 sporulation family protein [Deltaproteobacteria bacterium]|nr:stage 0 sporulation family protein [Deltaproteobacteria bacterium]